MIDKIKLYQVIAESLCVEPERISDKETLERLGADEVFKAMLVIIIEKEFKVEISDEEWEKIITVGDVIVCLERKGCA